MSTTQARTTPLSAPPSPNGDAPVAPAIVHGAPSGDDPAAEARRRHRFDAGLRSLRVGGGALRFGERTLMILGGVLAPVGIVVVLLGWWGASQTPFVFEQVPYLISGGLFGLALVFLGAFLYFTHWLTQLVREHRAQSALVVEALQQLQDQVARLGDGQPHAISGSAPPAVASVLVATARGTMAHRPDCVVVAGKDGLRRVSAADGLEPCKLCDPST